MKEDPDTRLQMGAGSQEASDTVSDLEANLRGAFRRLADSEELDTPLLQLPLAQLRLAHALYCVEGDGGEPMGRLSEKLGASHSALTQAADRLVQRGLAERHADAQDRRVVRLSLTALGREWVSERRSRRRQRIEEMWSALLPEEQQRMASAAATLKELTDRAMHRLDRRSNRSATEAVHSASADRLDLDFEVTNPAAVGRREGE